MHRRFVVIARITLDAAQRQGWIAEDGVGQSGSERNVVSGTDERCRLPEPVCSNQANGLAGSDIRQLENDLVGVQVEVSQMTATAVDRVELAGVSISSRVVVEAVAVVPIG